jgi:nitrile hydratase
MNGAQDLGGMMGFGPVEPEKDEPFFHAAWEKRALGVTLACGALGEWSLDASRHARETLHPADYLASSYYEIWLKGLEKLLAARGLVMPDEIEAGHSLRSAPPTRRPRLMAQDVAAALARGGPTDRAPQAPARFRIGDRVRTIVTHPTTHTRLPRYARGKTGTVEMIHGAHVLPDSNAHGLGENPQWLYTVSFSGRELWGKDADPQLVVSIDAFEPYLEPA